MLPRRSSVACRSAVIAFRDHCQLFLIDVFLQPGQRHFPLKEAPENQNNQGSLSLIFESLKRGKLFPRLSSKRK
jgi:hypothetical protein